MLFSAQKCFLALLTAVLALGGCSAIGSFTTMVDSYPVVHIDNGINFINSKELKKIHIKVSNLVLIPGLSAEQGLKEKISELEKYQLVKSAHEADLGVEVRIVSMAPISEETFGRISKYWAYRATIDANVLNSSEDLNGKNTFSISDDGFAMNGGSTGRSGGGRSSAVDSLAKQDTIAGAVIGGSVAAVAGASPALIAVGTIAGASGAGILEKLTTVALDMVIVEVVVKERILISDSDSKTKYKSFSALSKNTVAEVYVEHAKQKETTIEHGSKFFIVVKSMALAPFDINKKIDNIIVGVVVELLR